MVMRRGNWRPGSLSHPNVMLLYLFLFINYIWKYTPKSRWYPTTKCRLLPSLLYKKVGGIPPLLGFLVCDYCYLPSLAILAKMKDRFATGSGSSTFFSGNSCFRPILLKNSLLTVIQSILANSNHLTYCFY